jgi:hypothetical protein
MITKIPQLISCFIYMIMGQQLGHTLGGPQALNFTALCHGTDKFS